MANYLPGEALTAERANRMAMRKLFVHDFAFQTSTTYDSQRLVVERDCTLVRIAGRFKTAPAGAAAICNVKKNGTALFAGAGRPSVAAGEYTMELDDIDVTLQAGDYLEWVDEQKGSSVAGGYGTIVLEFA